MLHALEADRAVVPAIWPLEIANALLNAERRRRLSEVEARWVVEQLARLPIDVDEGPLGRLLEQAWVLGRHHRLSAYDAAYLDLAMRRALPLASHDQALRRAARAAGVELFVAVDG